MQNSLFYTATEVQEMLGVSRGKAYQVVHKLNGELQDMGYIIVAGKVPKKFFEEHFYGMDLQKNAETVCEVSA